MAYKLYNSTILQHFYIKRPTFAVCNHLLDLLLSDENGLIEP